MFLLGYFESGQLGMNNQPQTTTQYKNNIFAIIVHSKGIYRNGNKGTTQSPYRGSNILDAP